MRGLACLVLACGCDKLLGLASVHLPADASASADARIGAEPVPMPDAAPTCPGSGVPMFDTNPNLAALGCTDYSLSESAGLAIGICGSNVLSSGPIDQPMTPASVSSSGSDFSLPVIDADGDEIIVTEYIVGTGLFTPSLLVASGSAWQDGTLMLPFAPQDGDWYTAPTRQPNRRMLWYQSQGSTWHDLYETTRDTWIESRAFTTGSLGVLELSSPQLTSDGLQLIGYGTIDMSSYGYLYTQRAAVTDVFAPMQMITTVQNTVTAAFLTDGCARMYFDVGSLNGTYYVRQK